MAEIVAVFDALAALRTVRETGAHRIIATHGNTDALVRVLNEDGIRTDIFRTGYGDVDEAG